MGSRAIGYWLILFSLGIITCLWWAFAFLPVQVHSAEWLSRAQAVCFGLTPNGLPNEGGWILLTFAPASMLVALWAIAGNDIKNELSDLVSGQFRKRVLAFALVLLVSEGIWAATRVIGATQQVPQSLNLAVGSEDLPADYPRAGKPAPHFELIDQHGQKITEAQLHGKVSMMVYVFAHCPSVCPGLVHQASVVLQEIANPKLQVLFITLDPERDTPSSLPSLAKRWNLPARSYFLSGKSKNVREALQGFNVPNVRDEQTGEIIHPALISFVDQQGRIAYQFTNPSQKWLNHASTRLLNE